MEIKKLSIPDAAYIAGIIDGEGCIAVRWVRSRNTKTIQTQITVGNTDEKLSKYLLETTGIGFSRPYKRGGVAAEKWKPMWVWSISSRSGYALLEQISPYLKLKSTQAQLFMEIVALKSQSNRSGRFNEQRQEEIVQEMKKLNQRGVKEKGEESV